jgi:hypothetical protein
MFSNRSTHSLVPAFWLKTRMPGWSWSITRRMVQNLLKVRLDAHFICAREHRYIWRVLNHQHLHERSQPNQFLVDPMAGDQEEFNRNEQKYFVRSKLSHLILKCQNTTHTKEGVGYNRTILIMDFLLWKQGSPVTNQKTIWELLVKHWTTNDCLTESFHVTWAVAFNICNYRFQIHDKFDTLHHSWCRNYHY